MRNVSLGSPTEVAMLIPSILGFEPEESVVILGIGGAPTARIDLPGASVHDYAELSAALSAPVLEWRKRGVIVAIYTADPELYAYWLKHGSMCLPGVEVIDTIRVHGGRWYGPGSTEGNPFVTDPTVSHSREALVAQASAIDSAVEAERLAVTAWHEGDGARAWCLYDRAVHLAGHESEHMARLAHALAAAINPHTATCDEFGLPIGRPS